MNDALADYLDENGFRVEEYTSETVRLKMFGRYFDFPNTKDRQWAIPLHDVHHVATGYGTDWVGEAEIGAWELRAGCRTAVVYWLNATAVAIGLFLAPRRILAAWRAAKGAKALYRAGFSYDEVKTWSVGTLREKLGIGKNGLAGERRLHTDAEAARQQARGHGLKAAASAAG
ncbi:MAG: hypothetical protein IPK82_07595 [Polyangiaceae bacterium]|nr:hypothetical protein [Polyangiaceae bacterium]